MAQTAHAKMRYAINFDKTINRLVPYYLGGRKLILFLQSCVKPLQYINKQFVDYAKETRIEASMTSQIFKLEWFLNRKFRKYFDNQVSLISIKNGDKLGSPVYFEEASEIPEDEEFKLWHEEESPDRPVLYNRNETTEGSTYSFLVYVPKLWEESGQLRDGLTIEQFEAMLSFWIEKYRLAGKTYKIIINK